MDGPFTGKGPSPFYSYVSGRGLPCSGPEYAGKPDISAGGSSGGNQGSPITRFGTIIAALLAATVASITYVCTTRGQTRNKRLELTLTYVESQLKELYGPLLAECIEADSSFRRIELTMNCIGAKDHRHYDLRELQPEDFTGELPHRRNTPMWHRKFFAHLISNVYLPSNERRIKVLRSNMHLFGPYPPTSLALFMMHAAQFRSIIEVQRLTGIEFRAAPDEYKDRYEDPYLLIPFPSILTGEVLAKVAWLKALQREYRYRISRSTWSTRPEVYKRDQYYLLVSPDARETFNRETDVSPDIYKKRKIEQKAYYPPTFPLVWGPYTAVELFELRTWLISRERALRKMDGLKSDR
jgi:hypothetical protein